MISTRGATSRPARSFVCLDGVHALAAASVFVYHAGLRSPTVRRHGLSWISLLDLGVEIFFVLSGFLIYRPYAASHLGDKRAPELRDYARRRLLRIFPAYLVALFVLRATGEIGMSSWTGYLKHLTLTHTYFANPGGLGMKVSWTLVVELSFYTFVPVWAFAMRLIARHRHTLAAEVLGAVALIVTGFVCIRLEYLGHLPVWATVLPPSFAALGIGMLFAVMTVAPVGSVVAAVPPLLGRIPAGVWWSAAALLFVYLARLPMGYAFCRGCRPPTELVTVNRVQALIAGCIVAPAVFGDPERGLVRRALQWRPVAYVGLVSYGVYLWHVYVIRLIPASVLRATSIAPIVIAVVGAFFGAVAIASLSYYFVERPAMRLARRPVGAWLRSGSSADR